MQGQLWHESFEDALTALVMQLGGYQRVGSDLWPAKGPIEAGRYLSQCLQPERREKLALEEIVWLLAAGRKAGAHVASHFLAEATGYKKPEPYEPEERRKEVVSEIHQATARVEALLSELKRLGAG